MGFNRGAKLVTNGLRFAYDTGYPTVSSSFDTYRYNNGEPTTNLADTDTKRTITPHNAGGYNHTITTADAPEKGPGWKKITISQHGTNHRLAQFPYISHTSGSTLSYSIEYDFNGLSTSTGSQTSDYYWKLDGSSGVFGDATPIDNGYQRALTYTRSSNGVQAIFLANANLNRAGINDIIYYKNYQVEDKDHNTPFVATTRSISGSLVDLIGSQQIKLTQVSYDSNAQLTFDGTNDYAELPSFFVPTGSRSVEVVAMVASASTDSAQKHIFANSDQVGNSLDDAGIAIIYRNGHFRGYIWNWDGANSPRTEKIFQTNVEQDKFYHLVLTHDDSEAKFYTNGVLVASGLCTGSRFPSNDTTIGRYSPGYSQGFNGDIPIVRVYNRCITSDEVAQNFNSIKERFDI